MKNITLMAKDIDLKAKLTEIAEASTIIGLHIKNSRGEDVGYECGVMRNMHDEDFTILTVDEDIYRLKMNQVVSITMGEQFEV